MSVVELVLGSLAFALAVAVLAAVWWLAAGIGEAARRAAAREWEAASSRRVTADDGDHLVI